MNLFYLFIYILGLRILTCKDSVENKHTTYYQGSASPFHQLHIPSVNWVGLASNRNHRWGKGLRRWSETKNWSNVDFCRKDASTAFRKRL